MDRGELRRGWYLCLVWAALEIFHDCSWHFVGLLGVVLRLWSCVLAMLLTPGAKAIPQTHSVMMKKCCWPIWAPKSGKKCTPKKQFSQTGFLDRKLVLCKKNVTNIQIDSHPYFSRLSKNVLEVLHDYTANLARYRKCFFSLFNLGPNNCLIPSGAIWANVREKWLIGHLTVLPHDEQMLLTDLSSKVRKRF